MQERPVRVPAAQRGAALIVGLVVLGALLLLGIGAVTVANTQFKVSGNMQFQTIALTNAESAVATAENWLNTNFANPGFNTLTQAGLYPSTSLIDPLTMNWTDSTSIKLDAEGTQRYAIELYMPSRKPPMSSVTQCNAYGAVAPCSEVNLYRVSGRGTSTLGATKVVQTIYAVRTN